MKINQIIVEKKSKPDADGDGVPDWADKKPGKDDNEGKKKGSKPKKGEVPPQFKKKGPVKEGAHKDEMLKDAAKMSKAAFIKKYGKENADTWETTNESKSPVKEVSDQERLSARKVQRDAQTARHGTERKPGESMAAYLARADKLKKKKSQKTPEAEFKAPTHELDDTARKAMNIAQMIKRKINSGEQMDDRDYNQMAELGAILSRFGTNFGPQSMNDVLKHMVQYTNDRNEYGHGYPEFNVERFKELIAMAK